MQIELIKTEFYRCKGFAKFQFIGEQIEQIGIWRRCLIENEENRLRGFCLREV